MKVGEILRKLGDVVDLANDESPIGTDISVIEPEVAFTSAVIPADDQAENPVEPSSDPGDVAISNDDNTDDATMVPPLQQKHELLKKAAGVENEVDDFADEDDNEIAIMKKMAGIGEREIGRDMSGLVGEVNINPRANAAMTHFASDNYDAE